LKSLQGLRRKKFEPTGKEGKKKKHRPTCQRAGGQILVVEKEQGKSSGKGHPQGGSMTTSLEGKRKLIKLTAMGRR